MAKLQPLSLSSHDHHKSDLMLSLFLQTVFCFFFFTMSHNPVLKVRHDILGNRNRDKEEISVMFYPNLARNWAHFILL